MAMNDLARELYAEKFLVFKLDDAITLNATEAVHVVFPAPGNLEVEAIMFGGVAGAPADGITWRLRRGTLTGTILASVTHTAVGTDPESTCGTAVSAAISKCETLVLTGQLTAGGDDFTSGAVIVVVEPRKS